MFFTLLCRFLFFLLEVDLEVGRLIFFWMDTEREMFDLFLAESFGLRFVITKTRGLKVVVDFH